MGIPGDILVVDDDKRQEGYAVRALPRAQDVLQAPEEAPRPGHFRYQWIVDRWILVWSKYSKSLAVSNAKAH